MKIRMGKESGVTFVNVSDFEACCSEAEAPAVSMS